VSASPSSVAGGGNETVSWTGSTQAKDWVGGYAVGAANSSPFQWMYLNCSQGAPASAIASGSCGFTMPATAGSYEFRLFANDGYTLLATSNPVTVGP